MQFYALIFVPFLIGLLLFFCLRAERKAWLLPLACAVPTAMLVFYASTNPIPGSEGPGLLALMFVCLTLGTLAAAIARRLLPRTQRLPRSPVLSMSLWLLSAFGMGSIAAYTVTILCGTSFEGAALSVLVVTPLLYGIAGWLMPKSAHPSAPLSAVLILFAGSLIPAVLIYWSEVSASTYAAWYAFLTLPNRTTAPILFPFLFHTPQSAVALAVIRPLAVASTQLILTGAFGFGMFLKRRKE